MYGVLRLVIRVSACGTKGRGRAERGYLARPALLLALT